MSSNTFFRVCFFSPSYINLCLVTKHHSDVKFTHFLDHLEYKVYVVFSNKKRIFQPRVCNVFTWQDFSRQPINDEHRCAYKRWPITIERSK